MLFKLIQFLKYMYSCGNIFACSVLIFSFILPKNPFFICFCFVKSFIFRPTQGHKACLFLFGKFRHQKQAMDGGHFVFIAHVGVRRFLSQFSLQNI